MGGLFIALGYSKFSSDPTGEWYQMFERIGVGQWFRIFTAVVQVTGGACMLFRRTLPIGAATVGATMLGAAVVDIAIMGSPIAIIPLMLLFVVAVVWATSE